MKKKRKNPKASSNLRQISETSSNIHQHYFITNISESKYLPPEVWTQILLSLPAKTLLKFRCVCKSWCSIINDPDFIHMHLQLCKINSGNNQLLVALEGLGRNRDKGCFLTVREPETLQNTGLIFRKSNSYMYRMGSSCNGLLLAVQHGPYASHHIVWRLWNPCIRKSFILPTCPLDNCHYLLGYAPDSKDYKVAAFAFENNQDMRPTKIHLAVYSLRDQLWTVRNPITTCMRELYSLSKAVFFQGAAYWLAQNDYHNVSSHLGSFDFDKETINLLELPFSLDKTRFYRFLFLLRGSLAVFSISQVTSSIWLFEQDKEKGPWTLWFSGKSTLEAYQFFFDCIIHHEKLFYYENDGGYFVCGKNTYNIASCQVKMLIPPSCFCFDLGPYSESLVLSNVYGARDLRDFP